jgi:predicted ATPase
VSYPASRCCRPICSYATHQLHIDGRHDAACDRHATYYRNQALTAAVSILTSPTPPKILDNLEHEHDNLRAALRQLLDRDSFADFAETCSALWMFWTARGHLAEGQAWLRRHWPATPSCLSMSRRDSWS